MLTRLLIDDLRRPEDFGTTNVARTYIEGMRLLSERVWDRVYMDNDLGPDQSEGWELVKWLMYDVPEEKWPRSFVVVSANSAARPNIESKLRSMGYRKTGERDRDKEVWSRDDQEEAGSKQASNMPVFHTGHPHEPEHQRMWQNQQRGRSYEQVEKELERAYERRLPQSIIDRLETELAHLVTEEDIYMTESEPNESDDPFGGPVEVQLADLYHNYINGRRYETKEECLLVMRGVLGDEGGYRRILPNVTDAQIWEAAKDAYENRKGYIHRYKTKTRRVNDTGPARVVCAYLNKYSSGQGKRPGDYLGQDKSGFKYYHLDVKDDKFVHFTTSKRAQEIIQSGTLMLDAPYEGSGAYGVFAVSLTYGEIVPGLALSHVTKEARNEGSQVVAVAFKTDTVPMKVGYPEEVSWGEQDVRLIDPKVISVDDAVQMIKRAPCSLEDNRSVVVYDKALLSNTVLVENPGTRQASEGMFTVKETPQGTLLQDSLGGSALVNIAGDTARIIRIHSVPEESKFTEEANSFKRRGFFKAVIRELARRGVQTIKVRLQSSDSRAALKRMVETGVLRNPRDIAGISVDEYPTTFDISTPTDKRASSKIVQAYLYKSMPFSASWSPTGDTPLYKDPIPADVTEILKEDPNTSVRAAVDGEGNVYAWNGNVMHRDVASFLHTQWRAMMEYIPQNSYGEIYTKKNDRDEVERYLPVMRKMFPNMKRIETNFGDYSFDTKEMRYVIEPPIMDGDVGPGRDFGIPHQSLIKQYYTKLSNDRSLSGALTVFDDDYKTIEDLVNAVRAGKLLVHARRMTPAQVSDLHYGLDPEWGETLSGTEAHQTAEEYGIKPAKLVFASDDFKWVGGSRNAAVFVKPYSFQKSLGDGKVQLPDGRVMSYNQSPVADFENEALKDEPFGVERGDWYSTKPAEVVAVVLTNAPSPTKVASIYHSRVASGQVSVQPEAPKAGMPSQPGYAYHATNVDRLVDIAASRGLVPHGPSYGTDQYTWPDGSREKRIYFSADAGVVWQFAPEEGRPAVVRVKIGPNMKREVTGDLYTTKKIPVGSIEYLGQDSQWHPLSGLE